MLRLLHPLVLPIWMSDRPLSLLISILRMRFKISSIAKICVLFWVPFHLREIVVSWVHLKRQAEDEWQALKERGKDLDGSIQARLLGSMEMINPTERSFGKARDIVIPTIYLLNICNHFLPPLHFFTNHHIDLVNNQVMHTKVICLFCADDKPLGKVLLLDIAKMIFVWGNDDTHFCLSPLCFLEASHNLLEALKLLGKTSTVSGQTNGPTLSTNYVIEYEMHLNFFKQVQDFENLYSTLVQIWTRSLLGNSHG